MGKEVIEKLEKSIQNTELKEKDELLALVAELKNEIVSLSKTDEEQAKSIAKFAEISTYEATREKKQPELLEHSLNGLISTVDGFEISHPKLTSIVNSVSVMLSNIGI